MASSPIYNWPEPDDTSLVKNGALAIRTLGNAIDSTMATMVPKSIVDAKGDLIGATANDTPARLAVGTNGQVLTADSTAATGLAWATPSGGSNSFYAGKNKIINGDFGIWQRGTSFNAGSNAYTADRWDTLTDKTGASVLTTQQTFTAGSAPVAGYESQYFLRTVFPSGGTFCIQEQRVENVRTFAGQTVTLSFWAKANATATINPALVQNFGSGGSGDVQTTTSSLTLTTSWVRYSVTATLPSISGKTIGAGSYLAVRAMRAVTASGFTIDIWGVQLEAGSAATDFVTASGGSPQAELAMCQRYYFRTTAGVGGSVLGNGYISTTITAITSVQYPVVMRTTPTSVDFVDLRIEDQTTGVIGISAVVLSNATAFMGRVGATIAGGTAGRFCQLQTGSTNGYIGYSAEL